MAPHHVCDVSGAIEELAYELALSTLLLELIRHLIVGFLVLGSL